MAITATKLQRDHLGRTLPAGRRSVSWVLSPRTDEGRIATTGTQSTVNELGVDELKLVDTADVRLDGTGAMDMQGEALRSVELEVRDFRTRSEADNISEVALGFEAAPGGERVEVVQDTAVDTYASVAAYDASGTQTDRIGTQHYFDGEFPYQGPVKDALLKRADYRILLQRPIISDRQDHLYLHLFEGESAQVSAEVTPHLPLGTLRPYLRCGPASGANAKIFFSEARLILTHN